MSNYSHERGSRNTDCKIVISEDFFANLTFIKSSKSQITKPLILIWEFNPTMNVQRKWYFPRYHNFWLCQRQVEKVRKRMLFYITYLVTYTRQSHISFSTKKLGFVISVLHFFFRKKRDKSVIKTTTTSGGFWLGTRRNSSNHVKQWVYKLGYYTFVIFSPLWFSHARSV